MTAFIMCACLCCSIPQDVCGAVQVIRPAAGWTRGVWACGEVDPVILYSWLITLSAAYSDYLPTVSTLYLWKSKINRVTGLLFYLSCSIEPECINPRGLCIWPICSPWTHTHWEHTHTWVVDSCSVREAVGGYIPYSRALQPSREGRVLFFYSPPTCIKSAAQTLRPGLVLMALLGV